MSIHHWLRARRVFVSGEFCGICSIFVFIVVLTGLALLIYIIGAGCYSAMLDLRGLGVHDDFSSIYYNKLLQQVLSSYGDGGTRMVACLQLVPMLVVFGRWSKNLVVPCITFGVLFTNFGND
jgi:ABC-type transport system involved in multi-copper enzyme maturation permease subunit